MKRLPLVIFVFLAASAFARAPRYNEQFGWKYDVADNLSIRTNNLLVQNYTVDAADELTNISRTGNFTLSGALPAPASSLLVNGLTPQIYGDFTFAQTNLVLANGNNTFSTVGLNLYSARSTNLTTYYLPTANPLNYDNNGNLTNDGIKDYFFDAENQLTNATLAGAVRTDFVYDGLNRRRIERDYSWNGGGWIKTNEVRFIYDGYLLVQERDTNNNVLVTYSRGMDFSGDLSDAGGIGGLLARTDTSGSAFYHSDGSGNITALMDGNENIVGRYLYNPFGNLAGMWGTKAGANKMRFSSMPGYWFGGDGFSKRIWLHFPQRWANNDPIQEVGGINMTAGMNNDPLNEIDPWGLWVIEYTNPDGTRKVYSPIFPNGITVPPDANVYPDGSVDVNPNVDKGRINTDDDPWEMLGPGGFLKPKPKLTSCPILPKNPDDLLKMGYKETSHPKALKAGHRTFENPQTGDKLRFDKGKPGETGHEANDHYHQSNPNSTSKRDQYLDKNGNPVSRGSDPSHLYP